MKAIACSKSALPGACPAGSAHAGGRLGAPWSRRSHPPNDTPEPKAPRAIFATLLCDRRQRSSANASVGPRQSAGSQSSPREAGPFGSTSALFLGCKMWADPQYLTSWRDLRRRELLFWFFVLSYVPGILLIVIVVNVFEHDLPEHMGMYFSAAWLAGFAWTNFYRQNFRCPRCHQFFFRRFMFVDPQSRSCVNCNLDLWTGGP